MRLKYIDCLRGAAMFMVVYSHIISFCMKPYTPSPMGLWMCETMLPLFFFISGFVAYKNSPAVGLKEYEKQMWKKTIMMLVPTLLMMGIFMLYTCNNMWEFLFRYDKGGYWFTIVLFEIFAIYLPALMLTKRVENVIFKAIILLLPFVMMMLIFRIVGFKSQAAILFEWVKVKYFYLFFVMGAITNMLLNEPSSIGKWILSSIPQNIKSYLLSFLLIADIIVYNQMGGAVFLTQVLSVFTLFATFHQFETQFSESNNKYTNMLAIIGRYTLPIYLMHFFLLFRLPTPVTEYFINLQTDHCCGSNSCCSLVEFITIGVITILICYVCILVTNILKKAFPPIARWLLGINVIKEDRDQSKNTITIH